MNSTKRLFGLFILIAVTLIFACGQDSGNTLKYENIVFGDNPSGSNSSISAPSGVIATPSDSQVTIKWNPVAGAQFYNIYWSNSSGVTKSTGALIPNVTSPYIQTGCANNVKYFYVITATNIYNAESADSAQVSATPNLIVETEPNNTPAQANVIIINGIPFKGQIANANDIDYYRFDLASSGTLRLFIKPESCMYSLDDLKDDIQTSIIDSSGNILSSAFVDCNFTTEVELSSGIPSAGDYYLKVNGFPVYDIVNGISIFNGTSYFTDYYKVTPYFY